MRPFSEEFVGAAGELLAARHRAHRAVEPLLPAEYEDPAAASAEVEALAATEGASGAVALREGRLVGYLLGAPRTNDDLGAERLGRARRACGRGGRGPARPLRGGCRTLARGGRPRHYAVVPESDSAIVEAWFRARFGQQHAFGIREVPEASPGRTTSAARSRATSTRSSR